MSNIILATAMLVTVLMNSFSAQTKATTQATTTDETTFSNPISEVYADYIGLKNSLTKDNVDSAAAYSKKLFNDIDKVQIDKLTANQHSSWMKYKTKLSYDAEHIKGSTELEHQRGYFISLSKTMYDLLKAFKTNTETVYYQFCPMANDGKGAYWISENSKIVNPYFGKRMLSCGSTKETITVK